MLATQNRPNRSFDSIVAGRSSGSIVLSNLAKVQIPQIADLARENIGPDIADQTVFQKVLDYNRECNWVIYRRDDQDPYLHRLIGFTSFLLLNKIGLEAVGRDAFVGKNPDLSMLCGAEDAPAALYWWATVSVSATAQMLPPVVEALRAARYRGLDIFTRAGTPHGARILGNLGFVPVLAGRRGEVGDLLVYRRTRAANTLAA